ncbi:hypothetical protein FRC16_010502 [Serendipita sp. 398]|nr:hypothetical protein FRC16_010502 [Serendipita sp. 398]
MIYASDRGLDVLRFHFFMEKDKRSRCARFVWSPQLIPLSYFRRHDLENWSLVQHRPYRNLASLLSTSTSSHSFQSAVQTSKRWRPFICFIRPISLVLSFEHTS